MDGQRLDIDWTRCDAHGLCAELLPELLELDDWGYPVAVHGEVVVVPAGLHEHADHAVRACPRLALSLRPLRSP
jgi:ferredoxin